MRPLFLEPVESENAGKGGLMWSTMSQDSGEHDEKVVSRAFEAGQEETLAEVAGTVLPKLISEYQTFAAQSAPDDPKAFAAFHSACRAALTHLVMLEKLVGDERGTIVAETEARPDAGIDALLAEARNVLDRYPETVE